MPGHIWARAYAHFGHVMATKKHVSLHNYVNKLVPVSIKCSKCALSQAQIVFGQQQYVSGLH
jgi:hypothetical protein